MNIYCKLAMYIVKYILKITACYNALIQLHQDKNIFTNAPVRNNV